MLSSIHPLGERARQNRWLITVTAFTLAAAVTGGGLGALLGWLGDVLAIDGWPMTNRLLVVAIAAVGAAIADLARRRVPGPERQVDERWIGRFRGWVYGAGFGAQLAAGSATYVVTWGVYATYLIALLAATPVGGALIGLVFGVARSLTLWAAGWIDRPSRLSVFHQRMREWASPSRVWVAVGYAGMSAGGLTMAMRWPF
jgi:hypothetical protein